jgi:hypothetical protein
MEMIRKKKKANSLLWLFEPLEDDPRYLRKRFFSFEAAYLDGRLCLAVVDRGEPWNGMMACTSREHHASLQSEFSHWKPHPVLGKWLYISQLHPEFESVAAEMVEAARKRDPRLGIEGDVRKKRKATRPRRKKRRG